MIRVHLRRGGLWGGVLRLSPEYHRERANVLNVDHAAGTWKLTANRRGHPTQLVPLDRLDGTVSLLDVVDRAIPTLRQEDKEGRLIAEYLRPVSTSSSVERAFVIRTVRYGVRSVLNIDGQDIDRNPPDGESIDAMVLFTVADRSLMGGLTIHLPHRRGGLKTPLEKCIKSELENALNPTQPVSLRIEAFAHESAVRAALSNDDVKELRLVAHERPTDEFADAEQYALGQDIGRVETRIVPRRLGRLRGKPIADALDSDDAHERLLTFEGMRYDRAEVRVSMPNDRERTIRISNESSRMGHALLYELEVENAPTDEDLLDALRDITPSDQLNTSTM